MNRFAIRGEKKNRHVHEGLVLAHKPYYALWSFKVDNNELPGSAEDKKYDDALYFGVLGRAGDKGDAMARFDQFKIAAGE
jgi:hypothetical protein